MSNNQLDIWPPFRLIGMSWVLLIIIFLLPNQTWGITLKLLLGAYLLFAIIRGSFHQMWDEYVSMGAFVTMQTIWFIGILWTSNSFWYFKLLFAFLIILGIKTKLHQIKNINKGLGAKLN